MFGVPNLDLQKSIMLMNSQGVSDAGYDYAITTLTQIEKEILTEAKQYKFKISDYVPVLPGKHAWMQQITRNLTAPVAGSFFDGDVFGGGNDRNTEADTVVKPKTIQINNWKKKVSYNIFEVQQALVSQNFDIIEQRLRARKKNWDLGLQEVAMIGHPTDSEIPGLLTNSTVTPDLTVITDAISKLSADDFQAFVATLLSAFFANTNSTVVPNRFIIPATDYLGLGAAASASFPNISKLKYLEDAFQIVLKGFNLAQNPDAEFKILPQAYCQKDQMATRGVNYNRYALYNQDVETMSLYIPLEYTSTQFGTDDNYNFKNVAMGQYTGLAVFRDLEVMYFDHNQTI